MKAARKQAVGIVGYVSATVAGTLAKGRSSEPAEPLEVRLEPDDSEVVVRVHAKDVVEARLGAERGSQVAVQLIVEEGAAVETLVRGRATAEGVQRFVDPVLSQRLRAPLAVIFV